MVTQMFDCIITPKGFAELLKTAKRRVVPVDGTWLLHNSGRSAEEEFKKVERIPNAVFFDLEKFKDHDSKFPHMLPTLDCFNQEMSKLGLTLDDILVVYDRFNNFSASRVVWTLKTFGHPEVYLLTGLNEYKESYPMETTPVDSVSPYEPSDYVSTTDLKAEEVVSYEEVLDLVQTGKIRDYNFYDTRTLDRFLGRIPDPRPGIALGHIPHTQPMPFSLVLDNGNFPSTKTDMAANLERCMTQLGTKFDKEKPIIVSCGSGVTACAVKAAFEFAGLGHARVYNGSWSEWGTRADPKLISKEKDY